MPRRARAATVALSAAFLATLVFGSVPGSPFQPVLPAPPGGPLAALGRLVGMDGIPATTAPFVGAALLALVAAAFVWVLAETRAGGVGTRTAWWLAVAAHVLVLLAPLLFSRDVYSYGAYGRIAAIHGANPYVVTPAAYPDDALVQFVGPKWLDTPAVYGPAFTALASIVARSVGEPTTLVAWFRWIAVAASLGTLALLRSLVRRRAPDREALAVLAFGANPAVLLYGVAGGHNDLLVALGVVGALVLMEGGRRTAAAAALALAALVKASAAVPLLLLFMAIAGAAGRGRRVRALAAPVGAASALLAFSAAPYLTRTDPTLGLAELSTHEGWLAPSRFARRILDVVGLGAVARVAFAVALVLAVAALARAAWGRASVAVDDLGASFAWGLLAVLLLAPVLLPWYASWLLPIAWFLPWRAWLAAVGSSVALAVSLFATEPSRAGAAFDLNLLLGHWAITPVVVVLLAVAAKELAGRLRADAPLGDVPAREPERHGER